MKRLLLAVLGTMLYQGAYAQLFDTIRVDKNCLELDIYRQYEGDEDRILTAPPLKYMTVENRFYGWTHKMVMGYIDDHIAVRQQLDSTDRKPWIAFEDSMFQKGKQLFARYSDKADTLYDASYAAKLEAIRQMIEEDVYFMLGAVKPGNRLWIVRFKPRRIWANERWAVSGPTVVIGSEEDVKKAEDLKVLK